MESNVDVNPEEEIDIIEYLKEILSNWEVHPNEIQLSDAVLGYGSTSVVYSGIFNGTEVAIKECDFDRESTDVDEAVLYAFARELEIWPTAKHPSILRFLCFSVVGRSLRICSELCRGGSLFDLLHNCWHIMLSWEQRRKILVDMASAVEFLHNMHPQVMHRDLKSLNILLVEPIQDDQTIPETKLADFGFARVRGLPTGNNAEGNTTMTNGAGTPHWMAPEVSQEGAKYDEKVDVFSYAIIMYEVICRRMSFEDLDAECAREQIHRGGRPSLGSEIVPPDVPDGLLDVVTACWAQDPKNRPTMSEVRIRLEGIKWS